MTPVYMDRFGRGNGNCLQAAVASVLDLPLVDVPNFSDAEGRWFEELATWATLHGIGVLHLDPQTRCGCCLAVDCYGIGIWAVDGGEECHAIVMLIEASAVDGVWHYQARPVHDPNPNGNTPALTEWKELVFLIRRGVTDGVIESARRSANA